jgi:hypothetical protein
VSWVRFLAGAFGAVVAVFLLPLRGPCVLVAVS